MSAAVLPRPEALTVELPASPYPGLRPFEKREWTIFFGRESITDEIIGRLIERHVVALHGSSGSGKSSLVRAGVLPRLEQEHASSSLAWRTTVMTPGNDPLRRLAEALAAGHEDGSRPERMLAIRRVLNRGREAGTELARMLRRAPNEQHCVLIDQFEELFELAKLDREQVALFMDIVVGMVDAPSDGLYAILTMRSDYLGACARFSGLAEAVNHTQYLLPRMEHADLLRAIREPAELYGGEVSRELAERLIADARGEQDELPLIQHGLMLLWRDAVTRDPAPPRLSLEHYTERSGLAAVLSSHADGVLASAAPNEPTQKAVELLFRALTDINAEGQAVRQRRTFGELCAITGAPPDRLGPVIDAFRADRVSFLRPYAPDAVALDTEIDISHEALIRCWSRIADPKTGWLQHEFRDGLIWRSLLVAAESFEADATNVLGPVATDDRDRWLAERNTSWAHRYGGGWDRVLRLMAASRAARNRQRAQAEEARRLAEEERLRAQELRATQVLGEEQRKRAEAERQKRRGVTVALVVFVVLSLVAVWLAMQQSVARRQAERARAEALMAWAEAEKQARTTIERNESLLAEFGWNRDDVAKAAADKDAVGESLKANRELRQTASPGDRERRRGIVVEYFPKDVDANKVEAALRELGFTFTKARTLVTDTPTNTIWFGTPVNIDDVKLVALTLIRAGVQIRAILPIPDDLVNKKNLPLIQVGAHKGVVDDPPLTVEAIREASRFSR